MTILENVFVLSSIAFFLSVSGIYLSQRYERQDLTTKIGIFVICLFFPYLTVLIGELIENSSKLRIWGIAAICLFLVVQWLLDFVLKSDFRDKPITHVPYIILFYIIAAILISISFDISKVGGYMVSVSFWILLGCLIFMMKK